MRGTIIVISVQIYSIYLLIQLPKWDVMSVYTQLTDDQFAAFCQRFGVSFARAIPITQGIKNSNLHTSLHEQIEKVPWETGDVSDR